MRVFFAKAASVTIVFLPEKMKSAQEDAFFSFLGLYLQVTMTRQCDLSRFRGSRLRFLSQKRLSAGNWSRHPLRIGGDLR